MSWLVAQCGGAVLSGQPPTVEPTVYAASASTDRVWQWTSYAEAAGLSSQRVFDVTFEPGGTSWFATSDGLWRYDGYRWEKFGPEHGLPSRFVRSVLVTRSGALWVGTDAGAGVFDAERRTFDRHDTVSHLPNGNVRQIVEDDDGTLWFSCDQWPDTSIGPGGLASWRNGRWQVYDQADGLPMDYVIGYHRDRSGRRYALTPRGWVRRDTTQWSAVTAAGTAASATVLHFAETRDGRLFAQAEGRLFTARDERWETVDAGTLLVTATRHGEVLALARDPHRGSLWLARWDGATFSPLSARIGGGHVARYYHLREAPDGAIWCVGEGTILRWSPERAGWRHFARLPAPRTVDTQERVWFEGGGEVWWAESDGAPRRLDVLTDFLGAERDGTVIGRAPGGALVSVPDPHHPEATLLDPGLASVVGALSDFDRNLWLWGRSPEGQLSFAYRDPRGEWQILATQAAAERRIISMHPDPRGGLDVVLLDERTTGYEALWISSEGVVSIDLGDAPPPIPYPQFFRVGAVEFIFGYDRVYERDTTKTTAWKPVAELTAGAFTQVILRRECAFLMFKGGKTGQPGGALYRKGLWHLTEGVFDFGAFSPEQGRIHLAGRGGVHRQADEEPLAFDFLPLPEDALMLSLVVAPDDSLWVNTSDGVLHHRALGLAPETTLRSRATELRGPLLPVRLGGIARYQPTTPTVAWRFSWRLNDGDWSHFREGEEINIPIAALAPGLHWVEARAIDADGRPDATPARLHFRVLSAPLQERGWFRPAVTALGLAMLGLLWLAIARTRAIRRSNAALRIEIAERQQAEAALRRARDELEKRVTERTAELSASNASLRRALDEQAAAEKQRARLEQDLRDAQKLQAIGTLAGGIAHDFNNILTIIIPCAQLGQAEPDVPPAVRNYLGLIMDAANRAKLLVRQILAFSRRQAREPSIIELAPIVKETQKLLQTMLPPDVVLRCSIAPQVPPVLADPTHIHQVLMNLCTNAEHALRGRGGTIHISLDTLRIDEAEARANPGLEAGQKVRLMVSDDGAGMTEDVRRRVFEPFFTTKPPGLGTGLGLAVVHGIVQEHRGAIRIETAPGRGTRMEILLPISTGEAGGIPPAASSPERGRGERVLLVDDNPGVLETLADLMRHAGYVIEPHERPADALAAVRATPDAFDLVVTDLTMPVMSGLDLCREIRRARADLPVILITGFDRDASPEALTEAGVAAILTKPFESEVFFRRVRELLAAQPTTPDDDSGLANK